MLGFDSRRRLVRCSVMVARLESLFDLGEILMKNPKAPKHNWGMKKSWKKIKQAKRQLKESKRKELKKKKHKALIKSQKSHSYMKGLHTV